MIERVVETGWLLFLVYAVLGVLFAVAFHGSGLVRVDAGARGAGWFFRLLITPGIVALWPVLAASWRRAARSDGAAPGSVHRPVSSTGLRTLHRRLAILLAVTVPLAAGTGIALRPARPHAEVEAARLLPVPEPFPILVESYPAPFGALPVSLSLRGNDAGERQLELEVGEDLGLPSLALFWDTDPSGPSPSARRLGAVWGPGTRRFALPLEMAMQAGTLYLVSLAHRETVASASLPADPSVGQPLDLERSPPP